MTKPRPSPANLPLPGMAAISLWMLALSVVGVVGVLTHHYPAESARIAILILCTFFAVAGLGLMRRRRWGWALALSAVFLSAGFSFYNFFHSHQGQWIFMGVVNVVFFLYLVRSEVLERLH